MLIRPLPFLLFGACGWPNYANLPADDVIDAADDPAAAASDAIAWRRLPSEREVLKGDTGDNSDPRQVQVEVLGSLGGIEVAGELDGAGWNASFKPIEYDDGSGCTGSLSTGRTGDWAGDLDFVVVEVAAEASDPVMCARVVQPVAELGWELVVYPLNECGLPLPPLQQDGEVVGLDLGRESGGWQIPVTAGARYGVLLAGYDPGPNAGDETKTFTYHVGVSVIIGDEGREICPALPAEISR